MEKELAKFIEDLEHGLRESKRAEDRKLYERYLVHAACILSKVILNVSKEELHSAIDSNEKLWGTSWLIDPINGKYPDSYKNFKKLSGYPGYGNT